jgi:hypothetical protein
MHLLSAIGTVEPKRNVQTRQLLTKFFDRPIIDERNVDGCCADGTYMISVNDTRIPLVIIELKKELGEGGCDPTTSGIPSCVTCHHSLHRLNDYSATSHEQR